MRLRQMIGSLVVVAGVSVNAETGMGLVLDVGGGGSKLWLPGKIIRIDMKDDVVVRHTSSLGTGYCPRFSPDGTKFAYVSGTDLVIARIGGTILKKFATGLSNSDGKSLRVSYTDAGICVSGSPIKVFSESGDLVKSIATGGKTLCHVDRKAAWAISNANDCLVNLSNGSSPWKASGAACGFGISPDGRFFTQNLWESGKEHRTMKIFSNNNGSVTQAYYLNIGTVLGLGSGYVWNIQNWSGNSNDIMTCAAGKAADNQISGNIDPYIYNVKTSKRYNLKPTSLGTIYWSIYDYYSGSIPGATSVREGLSARKSIVNRVTARGSLDLRGAKRVGKQRGASGVIVRRGLRGVQHGNSKLEPAVTN